MSKRNCIFTGKPSDYKLTFTSTEDDLHNWAKAVPTTKEYIESREGRLLKPLNKREMQLVELFFEQELAKLKASNIEGQMVELRLRLDEDTETSYRGFISPYILTTEEDYDQPPMTKEELDLFDELEKLEEEEDNPEWPGMEQCPKCETVLQNAPGIGPFCPNKLCEVGDGPFLYVDEPTEIKPKSFSEIKQDLVKYVNEQTEVLTKELKDDKIQKAITKKKKGLWD